MTKWMQRIRGALGMGVTWAIGWAAGGLLIGVASKLLPWLPWDAFFKIFDAPLPALAVPGFIAGVLFSIVLAVGARGRRVEELSLARFTLWGAAGGALLSLVPAAMVGFGLATLRPGLSAWDFTFVIAAPCTLFSAASAFGYLEVVRLSRPGQSRMLLGPARRT